MGRVNLIETCCDGGKNRTRDRCAVRVSTKELYTEEMQRVSLPGVFFSSLLFQANYVNSFSSCKKPTNTSFLNKPKIMSRINENVDLFCKRIMEN